MAKPDQLSSREQEVANLLMEGKSNKMIASALGISERTVEFHLKNIYIKSQVSSRTELILKLGQSTGAARGEIPENRDEPVLSTVADKVEIPENGDLSNSRIWSTSLREAVSSIGKELHMESYLNSNASNGTNNMTFAESIRACLVKYAEFNGRASRSEFWWFTLFVVLVASAFTYMSQTLAEVFLIATMLPFLAAGSRRLHDIGRSGWWQLFMLVPAAGIVLVGILWALPQASDLPDDTRQA